MQEIPYIFKSVSEVKQFDMAESRRRALVPNGLLGA